MIRLAILAFAACQAQDPVPWTCDLSAVADGRDVDITVQFNCPSVSGSQHVELWQGLKLIAYHSDNRDCGERYTVTFSVPADAHWPLKAYARTDSVPGNGPGSVFDCYQILGASR